MSKLNSKTVRGAGKAPKANHPWRRKMAAEVAKVKRNKVDGRKRKA